MSLNKDKDEPEILIIRRNNNNDDDGHHGGVWKIAYADFMTAMMAFFLVMWLINASNEATRHQVASYFNPLKLTDKRATPKGIDNMEDANGNQKKSNSDDTGGGKNAKGDGEKNGTGAKDSEKDGATEKNGNGEVKEGEKKQQDLEAALFKDPYVVLDELAGEVGSSKQGKDNNIGMFPGKNGASGLKGGEGYIDPFDPQIWSELKNGKYPNEQPMAKPQKGKNSAHPSDEKNKHLVPLQAKKGSVETDGNKGSPEKKKAESDKKDPAHKLQEDIEKIRVATGDVEAPAIEVRQTKNGMVISLMDKTEFGMFNIGSAKPLPEMVRLMDGIGQALAQKKGLIIVRGFTDARPFQNGNYDNWRLSTARAHMARHMLIRGGVPQERFARVEGYADHKLRLPSKPNAAQNRRIEILLESDTKK